MKLKLLILLLSLSITSIAQIIPNKVRTAFGYNDVIRSTYAPYTYSTMMDDDGAPARTSGALGPRRIYVDNKAIKKSSDATNWNRLTLTTTHQNFALKTIIQEIHDRGASVIWCSQGAFDHQTIVTNDPPDGGAMGAFSGMIIPIDVYENVTHTVEDAAAINQFVVPSAVSVSIGEFIRVGEVKRTISAVNDNTPVAGQKTITVSANFSSTVLTGVPVNYTRNDPYDPDSYHEVADALAMVARIYGFTPDAGGLQSYIDAGLLATNTDKTGGPLNNGTGLGIVDIIEIQNEATLPGFFGPIGDPDDSGGEIAFDFRSFAACVYKCYNAIRAVDKEVGIMVGGFWGVGAESFYNDFIDEWTDLFGSPPPGDLIFSWHGYWRDNSASVGIQPEATSDELDVSVPIGWGDRGLFDLIDGWDRKKYRWIQGEFNWNSAPSQVSTAPIATMTGLTGTDQQKREQVQGILTARMALILMTGRYCKGTVSYWLIDGSFTDTGSGQFSNMGILRNQFNADPLGVKESMQYHIELMEEMGECLLPLQLVRGTRDEVIVIGKQEDGTIKKATWTFDSPITYSTLSGTYSANIYKDIVHDLALDGAHASAIATSNQWPAMRGKSVTTANCTYSSGEVVTTNWNDITVSIPDASGRAEIFIAFESGNSVDLISESETSEFLSVDAEGDLIFGDTDTGLNKAAGVNLLRILWNGADSEVQLNDGTIVEVDASSLPLTNPFYIGGGASIKSVFVKSKLIYTDSERETITTEFGF